MFCLRREEEPGREQLWSTVVTQIYYNDAEKRELFTADLLIVQSSALLSNTTCAEPKC